MEEPVLKPYVIGLDLGGTNSVFGIVDSRGDIKTTTAIKTQVYDKVEDYVNASVEALQPIIDQVGGIGKIKSMGIGAPNGNFYTGTIEFAPNLKWGHNGIVPLASMFSEKLGVPVALTNDANAAALGEMTYGAARGMKTLLRSRWEPVWAPVSSSTVSLSTVAMALLANSVIPSWFVERTPVLVVVGVKAVWRLIAQLQVWLALHVRCSKRQSVHHCSATSILRKSLLLMSVSLLGRVMNLPKRFSTSRGRCSVRLVPISQPSLLLRLSSSSVA